MVYPLSRLTNQAPPGVVAPVDDPLQHLVACHDRIEERLQTLERVALHIRSDSEAMRQDAHQSLDNALKFLEAMGALHTEDEESSLFPRLLAKDCPDSDLLRELVEMLESQHREKEGVLEKLLAHAQKLPSAPEMPSADQEMILQSLVEHLAMLYRPHIMVENQRLIPLSAEYLSALDLEEMRQEMRSRRGL